MSKSDRHRKRIADAEDEAANNADVAMDVVDEDALFAEEDTGSSSKKKKGEVIDDVLLSDEEEEEEEEEESEEDGGSDDEEGSEEDGPSDDGFDSDFIGDDADRTHLDSLPALEREQIIFDRTEKRKERRERWEAAQAAKKGKGKKRKAKKDKKDKKREKKRSRKSSDAAVPRAKKDEKRAARDALADLLARKTQKITSKASDQKRLQEEEEDEEDELGEDDESMGEESDESEGARRRRKAKARRAARHSERYDEDEDVKDVADAGDEDIDEDEANRTRTPLQYAHIKTVQMRRTALEKIHEEPYFADLIKGMFVRINVGTRDDGSARYLMCQISGVQDWRTKYKFGGAGRETKAALLLKYGKSERLWMMNLISNQSILQDEFDKWKAQMDHDGVNIMSAEDVVKLKRHAVALRQNFEYNPEVLAKMIDEKRRSGKALKNINLTSEKARISFSILRAQETGDADELERLQQQLADVEAAEDRIKEQKSAAGVFGILDVNKRNVQENVEKMEMMLRLQREEQRRQAEEAKAQLAMGLKPAEPKRDAFKRKETRPMMEFTLDETAAENKAKAAAEKARKDAEAKAAEAESKRRTELANRNKLEHFDELEALQSEAAGSIEIGEARTLHLPSLPNMSDKLVELLKNKHASIPHSLIPSVNESAMPSTTLASVLGRFLTLGAAGLNWETEAGSVAKTSNGRRVITLDEYRRRRGGRSY